jgi:hypothetical protein
MDIHASFSGVETVSNENGRGFCVVVSWANYRGKGTNTLTMYNFIMHIDPVKLQSERFTLQPDRARAMLREAGTVRKRAPKRQATKEAAKTSTIVSKPKPKVKRRDVVLHLTEAQERAFANYMEGKKL